MIEIIETEPTLMEKIHRISEYYSPAHQVGKAQEELSELYNELEMAVTINGRPIIPGNTWSEVADVIIMCIQLTMQHQKKDKVLEQMEYKVNRQLKRIETEKKKMTWQQGIMNRFTEIK